jgi:hypothetical protein
MLERLHPYQSEEYVNQSLSEAVPPGCWSFARALDRDIQRNSPTCYDMVHMNVKLKGASSSKHLVVHWHLVVFVAASPPKHHSMDPPLIEKDLALCCLHLCRHPVVDRLLALSGHPIVVDCLFETPPVAPEKVPVPPEWP